MGGEFLIGQCSDILDGGSRRYQQAVRWVRVGQRLQALLPDYRIQFLRDTRVLIAPHPLLQRRDRQLPGAHLAKQYAQLIRKAAGGKHTLHNLARLLYL